ncbi:MAG: DUF3417 domain-containing protein, partial [Myxococcales bacterium]|nr:DUF3417 domain-containing protein [Myxococcales bacterium]
MSQVWDGLNEVARNFWWCWDPSATKLFSDLQPDVWAASYHSPVAVLDTL